MFAELQSQLSRKKTIPSECPICATRPVLFLNKINVCQAQYHCNHSNPPARPHLQPSTALKIVNIACCILLIIGIINDIQQIQGQLTTKHLLLIFESLIYVTTIIVNFLCLVKNHIKIEESHGLITLINKKLSFSVSEVLSASSAKKIHHGLLLIILLLVFEEAVTFWRIVTEEELDAALLVRMFTVEIIIFSHASVGLYVIQFLALYGSMFERCYKELEQCLQFQANFTTVGAPQNLTKTQLLEKLQKLQRFYMCLRRNFKLNERFIQPGTIIIYSIDVILLMIGYSYISVLFAEQDLFLLTFDVYIIAKSVALVLVFCVFCFEAQRVMSMSRQTLSVLFKCPMSKLSPAESAQVEMVVQTLILQKPNVNASDIFTLGTGLLASVSGTVLTYALVALQFRSLMTQQQQ